MIKEKTTTQDDISDQRYCIVGTHKTKGQKRGELRFDTYEGAMLFINKVLKRDKRASNYICFLVEKVS